MNAGLRLAGKVAVITGAGQGIGRSTALIFSQEGTHVALMDKDLDKVNAVADEVRMAGGNAIAKRADVGRRDDIGAAVDAILGSFGRIDILVNNAGITLTRPFMDTSEDDIDAVIDTNLKSVVFVSQAIVPHMRKNGGGSIVHDASNAGIVARPWQPIYGASKAAIVSLTKTMALSFARDRIRVNCVCPGTIDTPMTRAALSATGTFEENWRRTEMVIPLGEIGQPEDVAYATLFLASDEAKYITGVVLPVDGGRTVGIPESYHVGMDSPARSSSN